MRARFAAALAVPLLALAAALAVPAPATAVFTSLEFTPADRVIGNDASTAEGTLEIRFSNDTSGTVELAGDNVEPISKQYPDSGVSDTISLPASEVTVKNQRVSIELTLIASDEEDSDSTTSFTMGVDTMAPPVAASLRGFPANEAVLLEWSGWDGDAFTFGNNAAEFRIYWSPAPLTGQIDWETARDGEVDGIRFPKFDQGADGVTVTEVQGFTDNHPIEGLVNGEVYYFAVEAIDHVGLRSGLAVNSNNEVIGIAARPQQTVNLSEYLELADKCFVVTAAGGANSPMVATYRMFRDRVLVKLPGGRQLVRAYYHYGPNWAYELRQHPDARRAVRIALAGAAPVVGALAATGPGAAALAGLAMLLTLGWAAVAAGRWATSAVVRTARTIGPRRARVSGGAGSTPLGLLLAAAITAGWLIALPGTAAALPGVQTFSLSVSPFLPEEARGTGPNGLPQSYALTYGDTGTYRMELDYTWYPLTVGGQLGIGGRIGYAQDKGHAYINRGGALRPSAEESTFRFLPVSALVRYRGKWFSKQPVIPSVNAGVDAWGMQEKRETADEGVENFVTGWHAGGELELVLDWIDRHNASQMQHNYGIVDTSLYFGWQYTQLDDFGQRRTLDFSHHGWSAGLRFQF